MTGTSTSLLLQLPSQNDGNNGGNGTSGNDNGNSGSGDGNSGGGGPGNLGGNGNSGGGGPGNSGGGGNSLQIGAQTVDLANEASPLTIVPNLSGTAEVFTIGHQGPMQSETFGDFASFVMALAGELDATTIVHAVSATGQYDSSTNTLTAIRIALVLTN